MGEERITQKVPPQAYEDWARIASTQAALRADGILGLLTFATDAILGRMHVEIPSRSGNSPGKTPSPLSQKSPGRGEDTVAHAWNPGSPLNARPSPTSNGHCTDREERLLRLVDILRTEQVSASTATEAEVDRTDLHRWRRTSLVAVAVIVLGAAAIFYASRPTHRTSDVRPDDLSAEPSRSIEQKPTGKIGAQSKPAGSDGTSIAAGNPITAPLVAPSPEGLAKASPPQPQPAVEQQEAARSGTAEGTTSPDASITETKPVEVPAPKHELDSPPSQPVAVAAGDVSGSELNKPALVVYFPRGSRHAETNAQTLRDRIDSDFAGSDLEPQSTLPDDAVIKFFGENNHKLARFVGKSLGDLGYRWRIDSSSSPAAARRNVIEVWLPR